MTEDKKLYNKRYYQKFKDNHICLSCKKKNIDNIKGANCISCLNNHSRRDKQRYKQLKNQHLCVRCKHRCSISIKCSNASNHLGAKYRNMVKYDVISHYCNGKIRCMCPAMPYSAYRFTNGRPY